jgi:hypothetical protein
MFQDVLLVRCKMPPFWISHPSKSKKLKGDVPKKLKLYPSTPA